MHFYKHTSNMLLHNYSTELSALLFTPEQARPSRSLRVKTRVITELRVLRTMPVLAADGLMEIVKMQILVVKQITETWVTVSKPDSMKFWWMTILCHTM